ncbi:type VI secretion system ATPase TssH, partial [bacterium M00.F.Ca.ET.230.01.1.1]
EVEELDADYAGQKAAITSLTELRTKWRDAPDDSARHDLEPAIRAAHARLARDANGALIHAEVDEAVIARVIADWTGVPVGSLLEDKLTTLLELETRLAGSVVGQQDALDALGKTLRAAKAGLKS